MDISKVRETHDKHNELYMASKTELFGQDKLNDDEWVKIAGIRLSQLSAALDAVDDKDIDEAKDYIEIVDCFVSLFDDVVLECVLLTGMRKEIETKILDLCKQALGKPSQEKTRNFESEHVVCQFIDGLIMNEIPLDLRAHPIKNAMMHDTNPLRLGKTLYDVFAEKYPEHVDATLTEYLNCEEALRANLTNGDPVEGADISAKLLAMPVNNPERYLLLSMVTFYNGLVDDAARTLEIGLKEYPGNDRLLKAQEGLAQAAQG